MDNGWGVVARKAIEERDKLKATIAALTHERDDLKGRMEIAGKLILNYIAGPFEFYTPIKPVVLMTKENHDALKQTLEVKP
jgi:hypothetical protein